MNLFGMNSPAINSSIFFSAINCPILFRDLLLVVDRTFWSSCSSSAALVFPDVRDNLVHIGYAAMPLFGDGELWI